MLRRVFGCLVVLIGLCCASLASAQSFRVDAIEVAPSDYLRDAEIAAVTDHYVAREITFDDLQQMMAELNALYARAGIPTARAILPPQEIRNGVLQVSLIEAEIETVEYDGFDSTSPAFLRRTLSLDVGAKPDFERLERDLMIYDISHDISPQLSFTPGETPGTTKAIVRAEEPKRFMFSGSLDNFGRPETGEARATLFGRWNSVTGARDTLSVQVQASQGAGSASLGYSRPVGAGGGRLVAALSYSQSSIIGGEFETVSIVSDSLSGSLSYRRPAWVRPDRYVFFEGGVTYETTQSTIDGVTFADISLWDGFFSGTYNRRFARSTLGLSAGLRYGSADALGTSETEGSYWLIYGSGSYTRPLGSKLMFNGNLQYQYAYDQNLPVARLITGGGVGTVRGYPSDIRGGDSGMILNLQISAMQPWQPASMPAWKFSPFAFVDTAVIVPYRTDGGFDGNQDVLASLGGGVSVAVGGKANVLAMMGVPLVETLGFSDVGSPTFYLGLDYSF